ncbi:Uncharacterized protein, similar to the N-terminal domain of Lon protease [hydrothermal vent metagenome]|uniref:Uncharacterized protein, similar to the N-terminal domain of Lon protease n=1 Tax=hydrothermal vent metagenome TaxID=652676 RepID=A0A3B1BR31_9ZZZZ
MKTGNKTYGKLCDLPKQIPVFPLSGALLLPGGQLPLNIFEPQYIEMFNDALAGNKLIAMMQPLREVSEEEKFTGTYPKMYKVGCVGRITAWQESGDGRYLVNLSGICRYSILAKIDDTKNYQTYEVEYFETDLKEPDKHADVDRKKLLATFRDYLDANQMDADWESVEETDTNQLVNALCMMSPYGPAEKQAMLEAGNIALRAETLIAITEIELAKTAGNPGGGLQ